MDSKRLIDILARVDEDHFAVIENDCAELYSKEEYLATPTPNHASGANAKWEKTWDLIDGHDGYKCSACGHTKYFDHYEEGIILCTPFCGYCGAAMENEKTGE